MKLEFDVKVTEKDFPRIYELGKLLHENYENLYIEKAH